MTICKGVLIMVNELVTNAKLVKEGKEYIKVAERRMKKYLDERMSAPPPCQRMRGKHSHLLKGI